VFPPNYLSECFIFLITFLIKISIGPQTPKQSLIEILMVVAMALIDQEIFMQDKALVIFTVKPYYNCFYIHHSLFHEMMFSL